jgi:hypothetical protein
MKREYLILLVIAGLLGSCASTKNMVILQHELSRLKLDSSLLEKRALNLQNENARLTGQSAYVEQAYLYQLQAKDDSIATLNQLIREKAGRLNHISESQTKQTLAFQYLCNGVKNEFAGYDTQSLVVKTTSSSISVYVSDKKLFVPNSYKTEYFANEIAQKVINVLNNYPELTLVICTYPDSSLKVGKDELTTSAFNKSLLINKCIILENKQPNKEISIIFRPNSKNIFFPIEFLFQPKKP